MPASDRVKESTINYDQNTMTLLGIEIIAFAVIAAVGTLLLRLRKSGRKFRENSSSDEGFDQSEWYDSNGNHVYYDRKIIRRQQKDKQEASATARDVTKRTT